MTWKCRCPTVWPALSPVHCRTLAPSHPARIAAFAIARTVCMSSEKAATSPASETGTDARSAQWRRGTTSTWPFAIGFTSRNATAFGPSWTRTDGISPARILQKMQSFMSDE